MITTSVNDVVGMVGLLSIASALRAYFGTPSGTEHTWIHTFDTRQQNKPQLTTKPQRQVHKNKWRSKKSYMYYPF